MRRAGIIATNEWNYCDNCRLQRAEAHNTLALHVHPDAGDASPREVFRVQLMSFLDESDWRLYRIRPNKYKSAAVARRLLFSLSVPYLRRYYMKFNCKSYLNAIDRYVMERSHGSSYFVSLPFMSRTRRLKNPTRDFFTHRLDNEICIFVNSTQ